MAWSIKAVDCACAGVTGAKNLARLLLIRQEYLTSSWRGDVKKYFSLDGKAGRFPRHPASLTVEDACRVLCPWIGFALFLLSRLHLLLVAATPIGFPLSPSRGNPDGLEAFLGRRAIENCIFRQVYPLWPFFTHSFSKPVSATSVKGCPFYRAFSAREVGQFPEFTPVPRTLPLRKHN
jgi:hypothetical protein